MGVIKSGNIPLTAAPFSMKDIEDHARGMLLRARKQAEELLIEAQREGEQLKSAARAEGHAEGKKAGQAEGFAAGQQAGHAKALADHSADLKNLVQTLSALALEIDGSRHQLNEQASDTVVQLAVAIARKVTKLQGKREPAVLTTNVSEAARLVVRANDVRIGLHPSQRKTLLDALPALKTQWPALAHVELVDDESISPGGCRIRTRSGLIDADLDSQTDRIAAELLPERTG